MSIEYRTTSERFWEARMAFSGKTRVSESIPHPVPPDGKDWKMVGSAVSANRVMWFWAREFQEEVRMRPRADPPDMPLPPPPRPIVD